MEKQNRVNWWTVFFGVMYIILAVELVMVYQQVTRPCYITFDIIKGKNFDQPYPIYHNCR